MPRLGTLPICLAVLASLSPTDSSRAQQAPPTPEEAARKVLAQPVYGEYLKRREKVSDTSAAQQAALGQWAQLNGLPQEARAHNLVAVSLEPTNPKFQTALGRRLRSNGLWMTDGEVREAAQDIREAVTVDRAWSRRLASLEPMVRRGDVSKLAEALKTFNEPLAIPVLERAGVAFGEAAQLLIVATLERITNYEACDSLIRHALYADFLSVRKLAADVLARRNPIYYVPRLVGWLVQTDSFTEDQVTMPAQGIGGRHAIVWYVSVGGQASIAALGGSGEMSDAAVQLHQARGGSPFRMQMTNAQRNERIVASLREATGQSFGADPQAWLKWLADLSDSYLPPAANAPPPTVVSTSLGGFSNLGWVPTGVDCFAAGTLVWARRGFLPIEEVVVGDLLASRDMDTGRIFWQPVIRRLTRPPTAQVRITANGEKISATLGHPFRVLGRRWVYARDLKEGDSILTADGSISVSNVERIPPAPAYSLEVANYNTYFVGRSRILVHDNTPVYDLELSVVDADKKRTIDLP